MAALIVSQYGHTRPVHGGLTLDPSRTERCCTAAAVHHACPQPRLFHYDAHPGRRRQRPTTTCCQGTAAYNGFYGHGIVNAYKAVAGH